MAPPTETKKPKDTIVGDSAVPAPLATEASEAAKINLEMSNELLKKQIEELKNELAKKSSKKPRSPPGTEAVHQAFRKIHQLIDTNHAQLQKIKEQNNGKSSKTMNIRAQLKSFFQKVEARFLQDFGEWIQDPIAALEAPKKKSKPKKNSVEDDNGDEEEGDQQNGDSSEHLNNGVAKDAEEGDNQEEEQQEETPKKETRKRAAPSKNAHSEDADEGDQSEESPKKGSSRKHEPPRPKRSKTSHA